MHAKRGFVRRSLGRSQAIYLPQLGRVAALPITMNPLAPASARRRAEFRISAAMRTELWCCGAIVTFTPPR